MIWSPIFAIILFWKDAWAKVKFKKNIVIKNLYVKFFFIYWLKEGEFISPKGIIVTLNINEFSGSNSESL